MLCFRPFLFIAIFGHTHIRRTWPDYSKLAVYIGMHSKVTYKAKAPGQQTLLFHFSPADIMVTRPTP